MKSIDQIRLFLEPESVAVIGAHAQSGLQAFNVVEQLIQSGYQGKIYPVNPKYGEIFDMKCYPAVEAIPDPVDLAIIMGPRGTIPAAVEQCAKKNIRAVVVVGAGFADADEEGKRLQQEIVSIADRSGIRILGPNTVGSANAFANFSTSFAKQTEMRELPVGVVCQSGMFFGTIGRLRLLGKGIDLGNSCDVDVSEALEYFGQDPDVKVIALHIEGIEDGKRFREVAKRVSKKKPIIALKTGRTEKAANAAQSHTGSLVGKDEVWDAVFKQCGIMRADTIDELSDLVNAFCYLPLMTGRRVGVVSASGGIGIACMDACAKYRLNIAELSPKVKQRLDDMSPLWFNTNNPLDIWPIILVSKKPYGESFRDVLSEVLDDPNIDGIVLFAGAWFEHTNPSITETIVEVGKKYPDKPIAWCPHYGWLYDIQPEDLLRQLEKVGMPVIFSIPDDALRALSKLAEYYEYVNDNL